MAHNRHSAARGRLGEGGFTLIELVVVILIIGILAAIAVPTFNKFISASSRVGMFEYVEATPGELAADPELTTDAQYAKGSSLRNGRLEEDLAEARKRARDTAAYERLVALEPLTRARRGAPGVPVVVEQPTPAAESPEKDEDSVLLVLLVVLAGLGVLGGVAARSRVVARRLERTDTEARWIRLSARRGALMDAWGAHVLDALDVLARPSLSDPAFPQTAAWLAAQGEMMALPDTKPATPGELERCEKIVAEAEAAWKVAEAAANKRGLSGFDAAERKRIGRAVALLTQVRDHSSTLPERQACYLKALELLSGLVEIPRETRGVIEDQVRLALPVGSSA